VRKTPTGRRGASTGHRGECRRPVDGEQERPRDIQRPPFRERVVRPPSHSTPSLPVEPVVGVRSSDSAEGSPSSRSERVRRGSIGSVGRQRSADSGGDGRARWTGGCSWWTTAEEMGVTGLVAGGYGPPPLRFDWNNPRRWEVGMPIAVIPR
jgi:hypothetical protein